MTLLWHQETPIGICVFIAPPKSLSLRNKYFGLSGRWDRTALRSLNEQLYTLSRVVIHPTFRGAGIASDFIRQACSLCPIPWIETLTQMGHINPFFERSGFVHVGVSNCQNRSRESHSTLYGSRFKNGKQIPLLTQETFNKSQYTQPVYYVFDNREACQKAKPDQKISCKTGNSDEAD